MRSVGKYDWKDGHVFLYWCSVNNITDSTTCPGKTYSAGASYPLSEGAITTLYAVWKYTGVDLSNLGDMQSFTCSKITNIGDYGTVKDARDGNTYRVRKLSDGKCWMIDNLRLGDSKLSNRILTSANTDLNGISTYNLPNSNKDGFKDTKAENVYVVDADSGSELKVYGGYYTWNAATAGTGASVTTDGANASSSICPKGWRLPTGGSGGDFEKLNNAYGGITDSSAHLTYPNGPNFLLAGRYSYGKASNQGTECYYWSSTTRSNTAAYYFIIYVPFFDLTVGTSTFSGSPSLGNSVRCIAK